MYLCGVVNMAWSHLPHLHRGEKNPTKTKIKFKSTFQKHYTKKTPKNKKQKPKKTTKKQKHYPGPKMKQDIQLILDTEKSLHCV